MRWQSELSCPSASLAMVQVPGEAGTALDPPASSSSPRRTRVWGQSQPHGGAVNSPRATTSGSQRYRAKGSSPVDGESPAALAASPHLRRAPARAAAKPEFGHKSAGIKLGLGRGLCREFSPHTARARRCRFITGVRQHQPRTSAHTAGTSAILTPILPRHNSAQTPSRTMNLFSPIHSLSGIRS